MSVTFGTHYDSLIRDAGMNAVKASTMEEIPYCITALEKIAAEGESVVLNDVDGRDLSGRFSSLTELFREYEMWGIDDSKKAPFFTLIQRISNEVAGFFKSKSVEERGAFLASASAERASALATREVLRARESSASSSDGGEAKMEAMVKGRETLLLSLGEEYDVVDQFEEDCAQFYGQMHEIRDSFAIYEEVMLHPDPFYPVLLFNLRMKDIFALGLSKLKSITKHPEALYKILSTTEITFRDLQALSTDVFESVISHTDELVIAKLTIRDIKSLDVDKLLMILKHVRELQMLIANGIAFKDLKSLSAEQLKYTLMNATKIIEAGLTIEDVRKFYGKKLEIICNKARNFAILAADPKIGKAALLAQIDHKLELLLLRMRAVVYILEQGITFKSLTDLFVAKLGICLVSYIGIGLLFTKHKVTLEELRKLNEDKLDLIAARSSCYPRIAKFSMHIINKMELSQVEAILENRHSSR